MGGHRRTSHPLHVILVLVVIPVALFALITLLVYLPSMMKGERYQPGPAVAQRARVVRRPARRRRGGRPGRQPAAVGAGTDGDDPERGGTSGRW